MLPLSGIRILHPWYPNPPSCPWNPHPPSLVSKSSTLGTLILHPIPGTRILHPWYPNPSFLIPKPFIPSTCIFHPIPGIHILHPWYPHPSSHLSYPNPPSLVPISFILATCIPSSHILHPQAPKSHGECPVTPTLPSGCQHSSRCHQDVPWHSLCGRKTCSAMLPLTNTFIML